MSRNLKGNDLACLATAHAFLPSAYQGSVDKLGLDASAASEESQRAAAHQVGEAVALLVKNLGLESTLKEYKVPEGDLEGIAGKVDDSKPEGAPYKKDQIIESILTKIY
jgi:alcohol dehydrogenase class IV